MKRNEHTIDRIVRVVLGVVLFIAAFATSSWILGVVGLIALVTGLVGFCPLYAVFGFSTCPIDNQANHA